TLDPLRPTPTMKSGAGFTAIRSRSRRPFAAGATRHAHAHAPVRFEPDAPICRRSAWSARTMTDSRAACNHECACRPSSRAPGVATARAGHDPAQYALNARRANQCSCVGYDWQTANCRLALTSCIGTRGIPRMRLPFTIAILAGGTIAALAGLDRVQSPSADRVPVAPPAIGATHITRPPAASAYSATSPHWPWIRTMVTDFRTQYVSNAGQRNRERAWTAAHFDFVMSGDVQQYKSLNPAIRVIPYALDWNVMQPGEQKSAGLATSYYDDMQQWFAAHPQYPLEKAFIHLAGSDPSPASRLQFTAWGST